MIQKDILKDFKEVKPKKYDQIPLGSYVRYFKDGSLKYGGFLKLMRHPDYMVLINFQKKVSWSVQFKDPSLRVWVRVPKKEAPKKEASKKEASKKEAQTKKVPKKSS